MAVADYFGRLINIAPAVTSTAPPPVFQVRPSPKKSAAKIKAKTTLVRSRPATPATGPYLSAKK